jgi:prevent-host-death family protein
MKRSRIGTPDASKVRHDGFQEDGMLKKVTITDARDQLSAHVRSAEHGTPVVITRRGRAVAVIVPTEAFEQLERLGATRSPEGLAGLAGGWEGSEDLVRLLNAHRRSPARPPATFD